MTALLGTFVKLNTMADGTPRLVIEMQCSLAEVAAMGLVPGVPFALARLEKGASIQQEEKPKGGELARQAGIWCADPRFQKWAGVNSEIEARAYVCEMCGIESRVELDHNDIAGMRFQEMIRLPYLAYVNG